MVGAPTLVVAANPSLAETTVGASNGTDGISIPGSWTVESRRDITLDKTDYYGRPIHSEIVTLRPTPGNAGDLPLTCNVSVDVQDPFVERYGVAAMDAGVGVSGCGLGFSWSHRAYVDDALVGTHYTSTPNNDWHYDEFTVACYTDAAHTYGHEVPEYDQANYKALTC